MPQARVKESTRSTRSPWVLGCALSGARSDSPCRRSKRPRRLEFKASVLGAYERGERTISVPRLQRLARLYRVPVDQLLPPDCSRAPQPGPRRGFHSNGDNPEATGKPFKIAVDLLRLSEVQGPERELLRRFLASVQVQRQDFNGEVLTIRSEDLRVMASMLGQNLATLLKRLEELGLLRG